MKLMEIFQWKCLDGLAVRANGWSALKRFKTVIQLEYRANDCYYYFSPRHVLEEGDKTRVCKELLVWNGFSPEA